MAEAAKEAVGDPDSLNVVADAGYSNGEQAETCEAQGIVPHMPIQHWHQMLHCGLSTMGTSPTAFPAGNFCASIYVFNDAEELEECCGVAR